MLSKAIFIVMTMIFLAVASSPIFAITGNSMHSGSRDERDGGGGGSNGSNGSGGVDIGVGLCTGCLGRGGSTSTSASLGNSVRGGGTVTDSRSGLRGGGV